MNNYYSPDSQWESGEAYTLEGIAAYTLPSWGMFTPTISGTLGSQWGFDDDYVTYGMAWGEDQYLWWNAGLSLDGREVHDGLPLLGHEPRRR